MSEAKFKTMRHIEAVRNYLDSCIRILADRGMNHDQSKLDSPEVEVFEEYTSKLKDCAYGSDEYKSNLRRMKVAIDHHQSCNRHHPEHFDNGIADMNLFDLLEMLVDWKVAGMRHNNGGDIYNSLEINQKRFDMSDELKNLLTRTIEYIEDNSDTVHKAYES